MRVTVLGFVLAAATVIPVVFHRVRCSCPLIGCFRRSFHLSLQLWCHVAIRSAPKGTAIPRIAVNRVLYVDDLLLENDTKLKEGREMIEKMKGRIDFGSGRSAKQSTVKFSRRRYVQESDYSISIDMDEYVQELQLYRMTQLRARQESLECTPQEHRRFRGMMGQLQWYVRMQGFEEAFPVSKMTSAHTVVVKNFSHS